MAGPSFEYVPVINDAAKAVVRGVIIEGIDTKHGSTDTDQGRLYGTVAAEGAEWRLNLYSDFTRQNLVMSGLAAALNQVMVLAETNASGMTGRAIIESFVANDTLILFPTFATDPDVFVSSQRASSMPTFDATYGLGYVHARAMKSLLTGELPSRIPNLFGGLGLAALVPNDPSAKFPDLRKLVNSDLLRIAQSVLVKAMSAAEANYTEEFAAMETAARNEFNAIMDALAAANAPAEEEAAEDAEVINTPAMEIGEFWRGGQNKASEYAGPYPYPPRAPFS